MSQFEDDFMRWFEDEPLFDYGGERSCDRCGEDGLHWVEAESGYYCLANSEGVIHRCRVFSDRLLKKLQER